MRGDEAQVLAARLSPEGFWLEFVASFVQVDLLIAEYQRVPTPKMSLVDCTGGLSYVRGDAPCG
jgi:hypothetical protein